MTQILFDNFLKICCHLLVVADQHDLKVELKRTDVHIARPNHTNVIVDDQKLGVQDDRRAVPVDPHASFQELFVVGGLSELWENGKVSELKSPFYELIEKPASK